MAMNHGAARTCQCLVTVGGRSLLPQERWLLLLGMTLMVVSSLLNSFSPRRASADGRRGS